MKTRCPECQTVFRVTPEQLKARTGKVRCGRCRALFNAFDNLLGERPAAAPAPPPAPADIRAGPEIWARPREFRYSSLENAADDLEGPVTLELGESGPPPARGAPADADEIHEAGLAAGLILPRETGKIPGYSKWAEGVMAPPIEISAEKPSHWLFLLAAAGLSLALAAQALFHFRGELAVSMPGLRPVLEAFSLAVDGPLPLPRHVELVSIETSDLQTDAARGKLLILSTTLRNKAPYGQAYPSLELSLTDTQDTVIARRVFAPQDYLPPKAAASPVFSGNSDVAVRLWIETVNLSAAGYRLFVFYP
ncbi:MAG: zinc-ribbon domain-containing protein [Candidatus Accumulibacter sp.]|jgi:predicted Zn finger-like uncharacterized protein|nr:zinc-ribbon domain-containing protein [Accumulibacter sp.]